jgi:hypothetical protein
LPRGLECPSRAAREDDQGTHRHMTAEAVALQHYLDAQRASALAILDGLTDEQLRTSVLPSGWTPLGLIKHLGYAERYWFQTIRWRRCSPSTGSSANEAMPCWPPRRWMRSRSGVTVVTRTARFPICADRPAHDRGDLSASRPPRRRARTPRRPNRSQSALVQADVARDLAARRSRTRGGHDDLGLCGLKMISLWPRATA